MNYYRHYLGDYRRDTAHLSLAQHGAYRLLLDHYYATEEPLPADSAALCRIVSAQSDAEREAVEFVASEFFDLRDGALHNTRADRELPPAQARILAARENGKRGGRPPGSRRDTESEPEANPAGTQVKPNGFTHHPPSTNHQIQPPDPASSLQPPDDSNRSPATRDKRGSPAGANGKRAPKSGAAWESYCRGYASRYGVEPVRNASANALLCRLVDKLGGEEAPLVAEWYCGHPGRLYVESGHCLELLARDGPKLRTEWATGRRTTAGAARQEDRRATNADAVAAVLADMQRETGNGN